MSDYRRQVYEPRLRQGQEWQDFAGDQLRKVGYHFPLYTSEKWQRLHGESASSIEMKFDGKLSRTGYLYIECGEKSEPRPGNYAASGIWRPFDLLVIGDYFTIFVLQNRMLRAVLRAGCCRWVTNNTETSQGFLFPAANARRSAVRVLDHLSPLKFAPEPEAFDSQVERFLDEYAKGKKGGKNLELELFKPPAGKSA